MFSKSRINEPGTKPAEDAKAPEPVPARTKTDFTPSAPKAKPPASTLSSDLTITGNLKTTGDIQVEGTVEGDIRAHLLTVGEGATIKGEAPARLETLQSHHSDPESSQEVTWGKPRKRKPVERGKPKPKKGFFEVAVVEGEFLNFDGNFRYALSAVDDLYKTMSESGKYYSVEIVKRPLDIESDNQLTGNVGIGSRGSNLVAEVVFRVVREVPGE